MKLSEALQRCAGYVDLEIKGNTTDRYFTDWKLLCLFLRDPECEDITFEDVVLHLQLIKQIGWKTNTLYKKAISIRRMFEVLNKLNLCTSVKFDDLPIPPREYTMPRIITKAEYEKLLAVRIAKHDYIQYRNEAILRLLWSTGGRNNEIMSLKMDALDMENMETSIPTEKSKGATPYRRLFWDREANDALKRWLAAREGLAKKARLTDPNSVFVGSEKNRYGKQLTNHALAIMLRNYSRAIGIPTANAHSFRHAFARDVVKSGGESADLMNLMGHARLESSRPMDVLASK